MSSASVSQMAWTNGERISLSYFSDNPGLKKTLLKMLVIDSNTATSPQNKAGGKSASTTEQQAQQLDIKQHNTLNREALKEFLSSKHPALGGHHHHHQHHHHHSVINDMSLLKFLAINALELSAPASPLLLEQTNHSVTPGWLQLSGHPKSIAPAANGIVRKRVTSPSDSEVIAYRGLSADVHASKVIPKFFGVRQTGDNDYYIEMQDLLHGFNQPNVMDVKIGCRTFLESEVANNTLRPDLYQKMIAVDPNAPTEEEHAEKAVTKLRYMLFREHMSSSESKGFRIEAMKMRGQNTPITNLKTVKSADQVQRTVAGFLQNRKSVTKELVKRLRQMRSYVEKSEYFQRHELVGSSVFIVYDEERVGAWMIDFAKSHELPAGLKVTHRRPWLPGNHEEGLLHGFDELIKILENIYNGPATKLGPV